MDPGGKCPCLSFRVRNGKLEYRTVRWWERPGNEDVHFEGRSHYVYGDWRLVKTIELYDEYPEIVLDKIVELATQEV